MHQDEDPAPKRAWASSHGTQSSMAGKTKFA